MRAITASEEITLIDIEKAVPKSLEYYSDNVHYEKPVFDLIADVLSELPTQILPGPEKRQEKTNG